MCGLAPNVGTKRRSWQGWAQLVCLHFLTYQVLAPAIFAQAPVAASDARLVNQYLDESSLQAERLNCEIKSMEPFLDFAFRFDVGYLVRCPVKEFKGEESTVLAFVRIKPESGNAVVFGEPYKLPRIPDSMRARTQIDKLKSEFDFSGGFSTGEGRYSVDVLVVEKRSLRMCRKSWNVNVARHHAEKSVPLSINEHMVVPMTFLPWNSDQEKTGSNLRVTLLLDAAPVNPYAQKLRDWDRSFLLSTLSSVLSQINPQSVKLVAFNLDQQREIFREEDFSSASFNKLSQAMRNLELGTVSYEILQRPSGSSDLLAQLANAERSESQPADVVIFLGPHTRFLEKVPEALQPAKVRGPRFFNVEYIPPWMRGAEFADAVEHITKALDGSNFKIHSPTDLAHAMQKMLAQVRREEKQGTPAGD